MAHHDLKAEPESFKLLALRESTVQIRKNDRRFAVGDTCSFYEWEPTRGTYTGHAVRGVPVVRVLETHEGLTPGWCLIVLDLPKTSINQWVPGLAGGYELPIGVNEARGL